MERDTFITWSPRRWKRNCILLFDDGVILNRHLTTSYPFLLYWFYIEPLIFINEIETHRPIFDSKKACVFSKTHRPVWFTKRSFCFLYLLPPKITSRQISSIIFYSKISLKLKNTRIITSVVIYQVLRCMSHESC